MRRITEFYDWSAPALQGITLEKLKEKGWMRLNVGTPDKRAPHAQGNFKTPSGKCELKASAAENGGNGVGEDHSPGDGVTTMVLTSRLRVTGRP